MSLNDRDPEKLRAWRERSVRRYQENRTRTRINLVGAKAKREQPAIEQFRAAVRARSGGLCEARTPACEPGPHQGHHAHHILMRSRGGDHDESNGLWLCSAAHRHVHAHPLASYENGWLRRGAA